MVKASKHISLSYSTIEDMQRFADVHHMPFSYAVEAACRQYLDLWYKTQEEQIASIRHRNFTQALEEVKR